MFNIREILPQKIRDILPQIRAHLTEDPKINETVKGIRNKIQSSLPPETEDNDSENFYKDPSNRLLNLVNDQNFIKTQEVTPVDDSELIKAHTNLEKSIIANIESITTKEQTEEREANAIEKEYENENGENKKSKLAIYTLIHDRLFTKYRAYYKEFNDLLTQVKKIPNKILTEEEKSELIEKIQVHLNRLTELNKILAEIHKLYRQKERYAYREYQFKEGDKTRNEKQNQKNQQLKDETNKITQGFSPETNEAINTEETLKREKEKKIELLKQENKDLINKINKNLTTKLASKTIQEFHISDLNTSRQWCQDITKLIKDNNYIDDQTQKDLIKDIKTKQKEIEKEIELKTK